jgi:signal transduction histidine kinase
VTVWLDEVVLSVVREAQPLDPEVAIHVERLDEVAVSGDPLALQQLLLNLLDNALRVTPPGQRVTVVLAASSAQATVRVTDEGPGIEPDRFERIFDRLYSRTRDGERGAGAGLGLAIARAIAEEHDGHLSARNHELGGATFELRLPAIAAARNATTPNEAASTRATPPPRSLPPHIG